MAPSINKVAIVIPVLNQFERACDALTSVQSKYSWTPVIVDQWKHPERCLSAAWNNGIQVAALKGFTHIIISNDDVIFSPWTIDGMVDGLNEASERVVMVTGCNNQGNCPDPDTMRYWPLPETVTQAEHPDFSCFGVRSNFIDTVGLFDENFWPAYFEDNDMHYRIKLLGYSAVSTTAAPYYHYGSASSQTLRDIHHHEHFRDCQQYFTAKWGSCNRDLNEVFTTPFGDPNNDPRFWKHEWKIKQ